MNYLRLFKRAVRLKGVSLTLILATLGWGVGLPLLFTTTSAASLLQFSATASSSAPSVSTNYIIRATTTNPIGFATGASTTRITFDPYAGAFSFASLVAGDITIYRPGGGINQVANVGACSGTASEIYVSGVVNGASDYFELTTCNTDIISAGPVWIVLSNAHVTNPTVTSPTSYVVRWSADPGADTGDTRVAIISVVTMTAIVNTNLTFTISGVASGTPVNGIDTTSTTTSATLIGFGELSVGTSTFAAQQLNVATNAVNGYSVTVTQNQNLLSNNGADIDAFKDGNAVTGTPTAWTTPLGTLGVENTYGHMGLTSDDDTLGGGDEFGTSLYAGLTSTSTRTVMYHTGSADGTTQNIGLAKVLYRVQVSALQEAAFDYTNQLTYVCTPVF